MRKILKNGIRIIHREAPGDIVSINVAILVGSDHEVPRISGIAHVVEHMLFEGTQSRSAEELAQEIDRHGGEMNAYTSKDKTNYYIKIHRKHAEKAIEILADMIQHPRFSETAFAKEKGVILEEIHMIRDQPRYLQWILFEQELLPIPASRPVYGTLESVKNMTRKDICTFHGRYYTPNNIIITVVGNISNSVKLVQKYFTFSGSCKQKRITVSTTNTRKQLIKKKKGITSTYMVLGYRTPHRLHPDSYVVDVIKALLARGQSGRMFVEVRTKRGLAYDIGVYHHCGPAYSYIACYTTADSQKIAEIERIFFEQIEGLKQVGKQELAEAKTYIEGNLAIRIEDSHEYADLLSFYEECGKLNRFDDYLARIKNVTNKDIARVVKAVFTRKYTKVVLKGSQ